MRYKEFILEKQVLGKSEMDDVSIDMANFYRNMDDLKASGQAAEITGKFESIDTITRLGLFATKQFRLFPPTERGAAGAYNPSRKDIKYAMDQAMQADQKNSTSTVTHELRHAGFDAISEHPGLTAAMPDDLKTLWRDGWGSNINYKKWTVTAKDVKRTHKLPNGEEYTEKKDYDILAAPEHAMLYAVQYANIMDSWKRIFFTTHPDIRDYDIDYWKDLYREANDAAEKWMQEHVADGRRMQKTFPSKGAYPSDERSSGRTITIPKRVEDWYKRLTDYQKRPGHGILNVAWNDHVTNWNRRLDSQRLKAVGNRYPRAREDLEALEELLLPINRGHLSEVPKWHSRYKDTDLPTTRKIWRTLDEFYFRDNNFDWEYMDIRNRDEVESDIERDRAKPEPKTKPASKPKTSANKRDETPDPNTINSMIKTHLNYINNPGAARVVRKELDRWAERYGADTDQIDRLVKLYKSKQGDEYARETRKWLGVD